MKYVSTVARTRTPAIIILLSTVPLLCSCKYADKMIYNTVEVRAEKMEKYPEDLAEFGLTDFREITLITSDSVRLEALYFSSKNGAAVITVHGYKSVRASMLPIVAMLVRHGYGVILPDLRSHGKNLEKHMTEKGALITFGKKEVLDLEAAYQYLLKRPDVDPEKIGVLGNSMGGAIVIQYAARNPNIKAVVAQSPFASIRDTTDVSVKHFLGIPPFPLAPIIVFLAERKLGFPTKEIAPIQHIGKIAPRPLFLMMGGKDSYVNADGIWLLSAAYGHPHLLWFDQELDHVEFHKKFPEKFETCVVGFFDKHLRTGH